MATITDEVIDCLKSHKATALAEASGVSPAYISLIRKGKRIPQYASTIDALRAGIAKLSEESEGKEENE